MPDLFLLVNLEALAYHQVSTFIDTIEQLRLHNAIGFDTALLR